MNLYSLLNELGVETDIPDAPITGITDRVEDVEAGKLFVCITGNNFDGHDFAAQALATGVAAVVCERELYLPRTIILRDTRAAFSFLCAAYYGHPEDRLKIIGITGTNGKTTTAEYLRHILEFSGHKAGIIGTLGITSDAGRYSSGFTTPSCDILFSALNDMVSDGCEYCVMEVSSQSLAQKRAEAITFELGIFTNIGSDHLDYHHSMDKYIREKTRLFEQSKTALINADDAYAERFISASGNSPCKLYSAKSGYADFMAKNIRYLGDSVSFILFSASCLNRVYVNSIGEFSVYNALAAVSAAVLLGIPCAEAAMASQSLPQVKGRAQKISSSNGINVYIDFAHTPQALQNIITALKNCYGGRIITVFGCGGNRDAGKRPQMGAVAAALSDTVILTSDNPRNEDENAIIRDILSGIKKRENVFTEPDRAKAISLAVNKANRGDTVLIAGKGHECYQITGSAKTHFSDEEIIKKLLGTD